MFVRLAGWMALLVRFPRFALDGPPVPRQGNPLHGCESLPGSARRGSDRADDQDA